MQIRKRRRDEDEAELLAFSESDLNQVPVDARYQILSCESNSCFLGNARVWVACGVYGIFLLRFRNFVTVRERTKCVFAEVLEVCAEFRTCTSCYDVAAWHPICNFIAICD